MEMFGRYQLQEKLGQGGMGVVYRAFDSVLERTVALKLVLSTEGIEPELRERLFREARAAGNLKHKNIVTIYDLGEQEGRPYLAMEYLEGEDLQRRLRRPEKMSLGHKLDLAIEICDGLAHAHARGVIHRDIKPANIFITDRGNAKLLDFGLARLMTSQLTRSNMLMGTINYMAPEQVRGERADHRSDIFSTGVLMYELLGGRKAFEADSAAATLMKILQDIPEPLWKLDPGVPRDLAGIVEHTLAKLPDERYQSMDQLQRDLEGFRDRYRAGVTGPVPAGLSAETDATVLSNPLAPSAIEASPLAASRTPAPAAVAHPASVAHSLSQPQTPPAPTRRRGLTLAIAAGVIVVVAVPAIWWLTHRSGPLAPVPSNAAAAAAAAVPPPVSVPSAQPAPAEPSKTARAVTERLRLAQQSLDAHDYSAALTSAEAVLLVDPGNADAERIRAAARDGAAAAARAERATQEAQAANARRTDRRGDKAGAPEVASPPARPSEAARQPAGEKPPAVSPSTPPGSSPTTPLQSASSSVAPPPAPVVTPPFPGSPTPATTSTGSPAPIAAPGPDASRPVSAQTQIAGLLDQYKQSLEAKNMDQLQHVWPSLGGNTQQRIRDEFGNAKRITVDITNPQISVSGSSAQVTFTRRYVIDTNDGQHLESTTRAVMDARKSGNAWVIGNIRFTQQ